MVVSQVAIRCETVAIQTGKQVIPIAPVVIIIDEGRNRLHRGGRQIRIGDRTRQIDAQLPTLKILHHQRGAAAARDAQIAATAGVGGEVIDDVAALPYVVGAPIAASERYGVEQDRALPVEVADDVKAAAAGIFVGVSTQSAFEAVVVGAAVEGVVVCSAEQGVCAVCAVEGVVAIITLDVIPAVAAQSTS